MNKFFILAQIFGVLIFVFKTISNSRKEKISILFFVIIGNVMSLLQYLCLWDFTGSAAVIIAFFRNTTFIFYDKKKLKPQFAVLLFFLILSITSIILTWSRWIAIFILLNVICVAIAQWQQKALITRIFMVMANIFLSIYCFLIGGYTGSLSALFQVCVGIVSIFRYDIKKISES